MSETTQVEKSASTGKSPQSQSGSQSSSGLHVQLRQAGGLAEQRAMLEPNADGVAPGLAPGAKHDDKVAPVQRKEVEVSAGGTKKVKEDTERVDKHGNQFEDEKSALEQLEDWAKNPTSKTPKQVLKIFYQMPPGQRRAVYMNEGGVLAKLLGHLSAEQSLRVMNLCDFPLKWKIKHIYQDAKPGITRALVRSVIHNAPLGDKGYLVFDKSQCELLQRDFSKDHPENLFGPDFAASFYPNETAKGQFFAKYPWYAKWAERTQKLDATARWAYIAGAPGTRIAELDGKPAAEGRTQWTSLLYWGPRGAALSNAQLASIDTIALHSSLTLQQRFKVFEVRFNIPVSVNDFSKLTAEKFKTLYDNLKLLPAGTVNSDTVTKMTIKYSDTAWGTYTDYPNSDNFGQVNYDPTQTDMSKFGHTVRHEMGHQTDTKYGGFTNFVSKGPGYWRKWTGMAGWLSSLESSMSKNAAGPEGAQLTALLNTFMAKGATFANPFASSPDNGLKTLWQKVSDDYDATDLSDSLDHLKGAGKHAANGDATSKMLAMAREGKKYPSGTPSFVGDRYFGKYYGEYYSWHKGADGARSGGHGRTDYTMSNPYDFYADLFASYFATATNKDANVPSWAAGHFKKVDEQVSRKKQTKADMGQRTMAEGQKVG